MYGSPEHESPDFFGAFGFLQNLAGPADAASQVVIDSMPCDFWIMDTNGRYVVQNAASRTNWGNLIGCGIDDVAASPEDRRRWKDNDRRVLKGERVRGSFFRGTGPGTRSYINSLSPLQVDGEITGIIGMNLEAPADAAPGDRTPSAAPARRDTGSGFNDLRMYTRGLAHDFNNLLHSIQAHADLAARGALPEGVSLYDEIRSATRRGTRITKQLLTGDAESIPDPGTLDLCEVVTRTLSSLHTTLPPHVRLVRRIAEWPAPVRAESESIERILTNLVNNAADALNGASGEITVGLSFLPQGSHRGASRQGTFCLSVADNGCGIEPERLERIFDPFHTSKRNGHGLGLWIVQDLVRRAGGSLDILSEPGSGSRFDVFLPRAGE
ncbi:MAG: PAS domain-containing protein [Gemmatimonadetes bacterium]|nr:PAS domain-containing protein [Gemmatimonadota bacterium]